jgi:hypothetical protein
MRINLLTRATPANKGSTQALLLPISNSNGDLHRINGDHLNNNGAHPNSSNGGHRHHSKASVRRPSRNIVNRSLPGRPPFPRTVP